MLELFGDLQTSNDMINGKNGYEYMVKNEFEHCTQFCGPCVGTMENENLSNSQNELLLWNWRWGISMNRIQEMMTPQQVKEPDGTKHVMAPIIQPDFATAAKCAVPVCDSCLLGISCEPISFWLRITEDPLQDLVGSDTTIDLTDVPFIMILPLD